MHKVKKIFDIAYGHRLFNYIGKCGNLHGHNAKIEVNLKTPQLNAENMVVDFTLIAAKLNKWLNENLDHKVILSKKDPLLKILRDEGQECYETSENPTAEALAELIFKKTQEEFPIVYKVKFWETDSCCAIYEKEKT
ncbi:MAG: 6-carboxytetrahydropterin synthase [Elusimicrobia bacterium]|nr:6-carboxytetrahydropterin synthase [Elusimicrobiota bacterium]